MFCGSDLFSIASLYALNQLRLEAPERIANIEVVCRPDKHIGRGLTELRSSPIKAAVAELGLQLSEIESFKLWRPRKDPFDLVVTVSFGLMVSEAVLKAATYGGLNVHPSLLPQFRGAAPLQHALLRRVETTGVSLQTMHGTKFDYGTVLDQEKVSLTDDNGVLLPLSTLELQDKLLSIGARLLVRGIENELFLKQQPMSGVENIKQQQLFTAPKINKTDRRIDWDDWSADEILLRDRVLTELWDTTTLPRAHRDLDRKQQNRIVFHGPWSYIEGFEYHPSMRPGWPVLLRKFTQKNYSVAIPTHDCRLIAPVSATVEGQKKGTGLAILRDVMLRKPDPVLYDSKSVAS